jgi:two-component system, OmpR family, sensor histidine kinase VicK
MLLLRDNDTNRGNKPLLTEERIQVIIQLFKTATLYGTRVRILTSKDIQEQMEKLSELKNEHEIFEISYVNKLQQQRIQTKVSILIVDSKACLVKDLKEYDSKNNGPDDEVLSLATYSNSESFILTYISIFETLWTQTELAQSIMNQN